MYFFNFFVVYVDFVIFVVEFQQSINFEFAASASFFISVLVLHISKDLTPELKTLIHNST
jgi:hypothetical protein